MKLKFATAAAAAALAVSAVPVLMPQAVAVTLRVANQGDATVAWTRIRLMSRLQLTVTGNVYEALTTFDKNLKLTTGAGHQVAQTSPTVWRFDLLRKGVTFHDGTPFTADDVMFSFARARVRART
jgi:peptide/nickel transport system substrate-binding protein